MLMKLISLHQDSFKVELSIKANGLTSKDKDLVDKSGLMALYMRVCGKITWLMAKEDLFTLEVMSMKENGSTIKLKEREYIFIKMELPTQANGLMINSMVMASKNGLMEHNIKAISMRVSNKVMELLFGLTEANMKDNLKIIIYKDLDTMSGLMEDNMKVRGETTKCMEEASLFGQINENMRESILMTRKKGMVNLSGQMEGHTKANGKMVNRMAEALTEIRMVSRKMALGLMERKLNGMTDIEDSLMILVIFGSYLYYHYQMNLFYY